ncbi:MAG: hypothetical protein IJB15_03655 [Clostridia bacterium]|nr:hypothetical protein [Clostridia bacterium]
MIKKSNATVNLDGAWSLAYGQHGEIDPSLATIAAIESAGMAMIPAKVPGNFELDLERAGVVPEIFYAQNIYKLYPYETMHQYYYRTFTYTADAALDDVVVFEGLDCFAQVYIDGKLVAESDNMFVPVTFDLPKLSDGEHEMVVHFTPAVIKAREIEQDPYANGMKYNADSLYIRKAPSQYGWDIMPRAVSAGIWKHVYIDRLPKGSVKDIFLQTCRVDTRVDGTNAFVKMVYNCRIPTGFIQDYTLKVTCTCGDSSFGWTIPLWHTSGNATATVQNAKLWWPHNYGDPNLYEVVAELYYKGERMHTYTKKTGIRQVELNRTSITDKDGNGEFCFIVNGKKIFAMGTNWVPIDAYHSRDEERLPEILPMVGDLGCNIIRCWGGNVYENEIFYDYCDEHGVMVWQDFAMACAIYPQDDWFQEALGREARAIIKLLRHHPCIVLWAGDNECDLSYRWGGENRDPNKNALTRKVLPEAIRSLDYTRPYLPSSPYVDEAAFEAHVSGDGGGISEDHLWGPRDYFKGNFYKNTICHFASETGYHGCPSPESLAKYIREEQLWPCLGREDWLCHAACMEPAENVPYGYRIRLMWNQVETLFGKENKTTADLETFSQASQISQAEAKKYFIERFRLTKWRRTGIIWWNLIDGWPQISDAIVDYYLDKKLAYWYIKNSQQPVCMMFNEPENGMAALHAVNDTREDKTLSYKVLDDQGNVVQESTCVVKSDMSVPVWYMPVGEEKKFYTIQWNDGETEGMNHYFTNIIDIDYDYYVNCAKKAGLPLR